jgi:hypothetical protein
VTDESPATPEPGRAEVDAFLAEIVGEVPRTGLPEPRLEEPERLFARKY